MYSNKTFETCPKVTFHTTFLFKKIIQKKLSITDLPFSDICMSSEGLFQDVDLQSGQQPMLPLN